MNGASSIRERGRRERAFRARYGPVGVVAGAAQGLGRAFSEAIAARGLDLVLVDRLADEVDALGAELERRHGVGVTAEHRDLAASDVARWLEGLCDEHDVGLFVCNAARASIGPFVDVSLDVLREQVELNCWLPLAVGRVLGPRLVRRGGGGLVFLSSLSGLQGSALVASYAATKAFDLVLAEGLWEELRRDGVDVVACVAGPTDTPGYRSSNPRRSFFSPRVASPDDVARCTLEALGRVPAVVPGLAESASSFLLQRVLPRRAAVRLLGFQMRRMYGGVRGLSGLDRSR